MCVSIIIGASRLERQGDLKARLGDIIYLPDTPNGARGDDRGCLCWVDVEAMAKREKLNVTLDVTGDYILTSRAKSQSEQEGGQ